MKEIKRATFFEKANKQTKNQSNKNSKIFFLFFSLAFAILSRINAG